MSESDSSNRLLVMIARDEATFEELVTGMLDVGLEGATIVDSKGIGAILRRDMPIFAGLAALLPQHTGSRIVFSLTKLQRIGALRRFIQEMPPSRRPIIIVLPIESAFGPDDH